MGALTESRKRFSLSSAFPPLNSADTNYVADLQPSKKPRITTMPPAPYLPASPPSEAIATPRIRRFPPPSPLRRPVHAPQRNLKIFGKLSVGRSQVVENHEGRGEDSASRMRNLQRIEECQLQVEGAREEAFGFLLQGRKVEMVENSDGERQKYGNFDGLGLEEYKRLVEGHSAASDRASEPKTLASGLTVLTSRDVDAGKMVDSQSIAHHGAETTTPLYRSLYESTRRRNFKLNMLDFELELAQRKMSAFKFMDRQVDKEDEAEEPFVPLTDEEEQCVSRALGGSNRRELLVSHENSNIEITREILQCLKPGAWLNDEVINLYLELLKERERREPKKFLKCHFFNTFFYKKLISGRGGYDFKAVRRWTTQKKIGYGLIECDKIFVPIHKDIHWCLAVINVKDKKFHYLDSLKGADSRVLKVLARYLADEVKDKSNGDVDVGSWEQEFVEDLPQQKNGWDCGVFMIKYADFYSRGLKLCFSQEHMPYFRRRTVKEILRLRAE